MKKEETLETGTGYYTNLNTHTVTDLTDEPEIQVNQAEESHNYSAFAPVCGGVPSTLVHYLI